MFLRGVMQHQIIPKYHNGLKVIKDPAIASGCGRAIVTITELERIKIAKLCGCPINDSNETRMRKETFEMMCLKNRGIGKHAERKANTSGWVKSTKDICTDCKIGAKVEDGLPYNPPALLFFVEYEVSPAKKRGKIKEHHGGVEKPKRDNARRLTKEIVLEIRKRKSNGEKVSEIARFFDIAHSTVSAITHRKTWRNV